jgi:hypothetical protein
LERDDRVHRSQHAPRHLASPGDRSPCRRWRYRGDTLQPYVEALGGTLTLEAQVGEDSFKIS